MRAKTSKSQPSQQSSEKEAVSYDLPDGGWGWWVLLGSTMNNLLITIIWPCFGIIFYDPLVEMGASSTLIAWIFNIYSLIINFMTPLSVSLAKEFGWRLIAFVGVLFVSTSFILSAFATSSGYMIFCFSILGGIGSGMAITCAFMMPPQYFDKRLGISQNIGCMGVSVGQLCFPSVIRYLQIEYGFRGATILVGGIILNGCVGASLFQPAEWHWVKKASPLLQSPQEPTVSHRKSSMFVSTEYMSGLGAFSTEKNDSRDTIAETEYCYNNRLCISIAKVGENMLKNITILNKPKVAILCICGSITFNALMNFYVLMPFALESAGYSLSDGATCISFGGLGTLVTRMIMAPISDRSWFNQSIVYSTGSVIMSATSIAFIFFGNIWLKYVTMVIFGMGLAMNSTFYICLMVKYIGLDNLAEVNGAAGICEGVGYIIIGPLLGMIRDNTGSYVLTLCIVSGLLFLPVLLFLFMPKLQEEEESQEGQQDHVTNP